MSRAVTPEKTGIAENHGRFRVGLVDGRWYDLRLLCDRKMMERVGPIPEEVVASIQLAEMRG